MNAVRPGEHCNPNIVHIASMILHEKNGTQQIRKTPAQKRIREEEKKLFQIFKMVKITFCWNV